MNLLALPAFTDNYIWMYHDGTRAVVVDPGDSAPVISALASLRLTLAGILVTHHHNEHVGGLRGLRSVFRGPVHGPAREAINPFCSEPTVIASARRHDAASESGRYALTALRQWKNDFR
jgi:glyoxylase-like metal-dependent hydrolase (beta-lactamase superfamily II)